MKLFKVRLKATYEDHYVFAKGYDEAGEKLVKFIKKVEQVEAEVNGILDKDGSLRKEKSEDAYEIRSIEFVTDEVIP